MDRIVRLLAAAGLVSPVLLLTVLAHGVADPHARDPASAGPVTASFGSRSPATASPPASPRVPSDRVPAGESSRFRLAVQTDSGGLDIAVAPLSVASHQPVDPPHNTTKQANTGAWIVQAAYPARPSRGTTYVYGHACAYHLCAFNGLQDTRIGNTVRITTPTAVLTYRVDRIGLGSKSASALPSWAADSTVRDRVVLVTCDREYDN